MNIKCSMMRNKDRKYSTWELLHSAVSDIFEVWLNELRVIIRDPGAITFFILLPLAYPLVYAYIYNNEATREVPVVVVDNSKSTLSREFIRKVDASAEVQVVGYCDDLNEAKEAIWGGRAFGVVLFPENFSDKLQYTHEQSPVKLYSDMSGLLLYKSMLITLTEVSLEMGKEIETANLDNVTHQQAYVATHAILASDVSLFNPKAGFGSFLIPSIMILLIQQALLLGVGMLLGTIKQGGDMDIKINLSRHYWWGALRVIVGKALCYFSIFALASVWLFRVVPMIFNFPMIGDPTAIVIFILPYLLACIFFAITLSAVIRDRESPFIIFVFTSVPLLFLSGISWPESAMADGWKYFSYLFPSTLGIQGYVRLNTAGAMLSDVRWQYIGLWIQTVVYFFAALISYGLLLRDTIRKE